MKPDRIWTVMLSAVLSAVYLVIKAIINEEDPTNEKF